LKVQIFQHAFFRPICQSFHLSMFCLYFVGGTFAAGKSTLCQSLSHLLPGEHLKASELIRYSPNPEDATGKATGAVLDNQDRLIAALATRRLTPAHVLLDGHFCLIDETYAVVPIPLSVFQRIQPSALVLVECGLSEIIFLISRHLSTLVVNGVFLPTKILENYGTTTSTAVHLSLTFYIFIHFPNGPI
jgi:hypothetical protein